VTYFRRALILGAFTSLAVVVPAGVAGALSSSGVKQTPTTGQPGTSAGFNCGTLSAPVEPGHAANSPGAPFNETLPGEAGTNYAGNGAPSMNHAGSTAAVSQYDTACRRLSSP
jgi:hypothetical protein